jgi:hypothetical protein
MELAFATRDLRALCEDLDVARDVLGTPAADQLKARLADMRASDNIQEFLDLGLPGVTIVNESTLTVDLSQGHRIFLKPNHPRTEANAEWKHVRRVQVVQIEEEPGLLDER